MAGRKRGDDHWGEMDGEFAVLLIRALDHEIRRTVLRILADSGEAMSPVVMARMMGVPLSSVSYHVNILKKCGMVEPAGLEQKRGAMEHFYKTLLKKNPVARALLESTRKVDDEKDKK
jgi:DNA-binding transcriptional ArsR family regulator